MLLFSIFLVQAALTAEGEPFPVPQELGPAVHFWKQLFLEYDHGHAVIHDRENIEVVWQVVEYPKNAAGQIDESAGKLRVRQALDAIRTHLTRLEKDHTTVDVLDTELLRAAGGKDSPVLQGAANRLRVQRGVANFFRTGLQTSRRYSAQIQSILRDAGVPTELSGLPFVETMFNPSARSFAGAAGLWQLMPATARGLGLKVTRRYDERYDILRATAAAARMLKDNYRMFGSWPLAITAYNHGPNGVKRAVKTVGSTDLMTLIARYEQKSFGFASKNFYAEFLAIVDILRNASDTPPVALSSASAD